MKGVFLSAPLLTVAMAAPLPAASPSDAASIGGPFKAAGCYIEVSEGMVAVINHWDGADKKLLQFPVGTREKGETPRETAQREVSEELGVDPEDVAVGPLMENLNTPERPVYLFQCAVRGIMRAADVGGLRPRDTKESAGAVVIDPDKWTYQSGPQAGLPIDIPTRFPGDRERMERLFPLE